MEFEPDDLRRHLRQFAVKLRPCHWPGCKTWSVGPSNRLYCDDHRHERDRELNRESYERVKARAGGRPESKRLADDRRYDRVRKKPKRVER